MGFSHVKFTEDAHRLGRHRRRQCDDRHTRQLRSIAGLSALNFTGAGSAGSAANTQFNNIKTFQFTDKFSWFKGRHAMKFGGRWLFQRQGFSYPGNEGSLGHFDYSGAFTGLARACSPTSCSMPLSA